MVQVAAPHPTLPTTHTHTHTHTHCISIIYFWLNNLFIAVAQGQNLG